MPRVMLTKHVNIFIQTSQPFTKEQATVGESFSCVYILHSEAMGLRFIWVLTSNARHPSANKVVAS